MQITRKESNNFVPGERLEGSVGLKIINITL